MTMMTIEQVSGDEAERLRSYARLTAADNDYSYEEGVRALLDEVGEVVRETGIDEATVRAFVAAEVR